MAETSSEELNQEEKKKAAQAEESEAKDEESQEAEEDNVEEMPNGEGQSEQKEEDFKEKYYYLAAEMQNIRKRFEREKQNLVKYGNEKVLSELIEVIDNLDRTLDAIKNDDDKKVKNIVLGVDMVRKQFLDVLKQNGVERVEALGEKFDPNFHEAMAQEKDEEKEDETIINEYQKGYMLNGRLLRPAKVVVVKNKED